MSNPNSKLSNFTTVLNLVSICISIAAIFISAYTINKMEQMQKDGTGYQASELPLGRMNTGVAPPRYVFRDGTTVPMQHCGNPVIVKVVPAGSNVWTVVKNELGNGTPDSYIKDAVDYLQQQIDRDPTQLVRDLDHVPVDYRFGMTHDSAIWPLLVR